MTRPSSKYLGGAAALALLVSPVGARGADATVQTLQQTDTDHNGQLSQAEVTAGLRRQLGLRPGTSSPALTEQVRLFRDVFGAGPTYPVQTLAAHPYFNPKIFGLARGEKPAEEINTTDLWVREDRHPLKIRRSIDDLLESSDKARGALVSYTNDFNSKSDQWAFHGIVGLNLAEKKNVHLGEDEKGRRPMLDPQLQGVTERWFIPSLQWDKVTTSKTDTDEIDALIARVTTGWQYTARNPDQALFDGYRLNLSGSYATDSNGERGIVAGELDFKPFKTTSFLRLGLNENFQRLGFFGLRPEFSIHAEGGTVTNDGGGAELTAARDFLRVGFNAGLLARFEQITGRFHALRGLTLHTGLQYYVDVTNQGPDVDLFTASADWALDPPEPGQENEGGHYTLTVEYRNGRAPLVLQRDNRITVGLGIKF